MSESHLVVIGGRSGVGKSTVAFTLHELLAAKDVKHAVIEGDALDMAHPALWKHRMAERNLAAMWANYRTLGYRRLIYTNTVSVLESDGLAQAMGDSPTITAILLQASDETTSERLGRREQGDTLTRHLERSARAATFLEEKASRTVHRVTTDGLTPAEIATQILSLLSWTDDFSEPSINQVDRSSAAQ
ncbi:MAG: hypothetical protein QM705_03300 [Ancrocorticia sp.]